jgi:hypothetical protein
MSTLTPHELASVAGAVNHGPPGSRSAQYRNLCTGPNARSQFDWMVQHMTPDNSEAPGIKRRAVKSVGDVCGWPVPK